VETCSRIVAWNWKLTRDFSYGAQWKILLWSQFNTSGNYFWAFYPRHDRNHCYNPGWYPKQMLPPPFVNRPYSPEDTARPQSGQHATLLENDTLCKHNLSFPFENSALHYTRYSILCKQSKGRWGRPFNYLYDRGPLWEVWRNGISNPTFNGWK
jgi:hypothetical protein